MTLNDNKRIVSYLMNNFGNTISFTLTDSKLGTHLYEGVPTINNRTVGVKLNGWFIPARKIAQVTA